MLIVVLVELAVGASTNTHVCVTEALPRTFVHAGTLMRDCSASWPAADFP